jgi:DNA-binding FadR family transcriptional regulator
VDYTIRRDELQHSIQSSVKRYIIEHHLHAGDPMPAEAELARQLGVSRPSLREAMKVLQTIGVLETRHGAGSFVGSFDLRPLTDGLAFQIRVEQQRTKVPRDVAELLELRELLECALVRRLAREPRPSEQLARLYALCDEMDACARRGEAYRPLDWRFHELLYEPRGNRLILQFLEALWTIFDEVRHETERPDLLLRTARDHRQIVDAIAAGDARAAAAAMSRHFDGVLAWIADHRDTTSGNPSVDQEERRIVRSAQTRPTSMPDHPASHVR